MSRNLYTFAVVAPALQRHLRELFFAQPAAEEVEGWKPCPKRSPRVCEELLARLANLDEPSVAYYRVVLDGWDHALAYFESGRSVVGKAAHAAEWGGLGVVQPGSGARRVRLAKRGISRQPNAYAIRAVGEAMSDGLGFVHGIHCPLIILHSNSGGSCSDEAFRDWNPATFPANPSA